MLLEEKSRASHIRFAVFIDEEQTGLRDIIAFTSVEIAVSYSEPDPIQTPERGAKRDLL